MVLLKQGGYDVVNYIRDNWTTAEYGTSGTLESDSDTALLAPVSSTIGTLSSTRSGLSVAMIHEILSTTANGTTLQEYAIFNGSTACTRITTTPIYKDDTKEIQTTTVFFLDIN